MTLRMYLTVMLLADAICWFAWATVLTSLDVTQASMLGFSLFYSSLFLAVAGTAAILGFSVRFVVLRQELVFRHVSIAFRQSFFLAALIVTMLVLEAKDLLTWYNALSLVVAISVLEFFLISYRRV